MTRSFATFGPSELQPPFTARSLKPYYYVEPKFTGYSTGQVSDSILHTCISQNPVFLINSRHSLLCALVRIIIMPQDPFSLSYEVILPSSFNIIILITSVYYTNPPVYSLGYGQFYTNDTNWLFT